MHILYIDESKHLLDKRAYIYTAMCIHENEWRGIFERIKGFRKHLRDQRGIYIKKEFHASDFLGGKGQIANHPIRKPERADIYLRTIHMISGLGTDPKKICLFNSIHEVEQFSFERLINRIQRTMKEWDSKAILIFDEGEEAAFRKRIRKMNVFNPIPSKYGTWDKSDATAKNIVIDRIIEDPIFKQSHESYFIQMVDFCAYALLRRELPIKSKTDLGLDKAFEMLKPICLKQANPKDNFGVVR